MEDHDADEGLFLEAIIANERVGRWIESLKGGRFSAVLELKEAVDSNPEVYVEEAKQAGVVNELTRLLAKTEDEAVLDAAAAIITACSGHMACAGKVRAFDYGNIHVEIREGMLGDGLGAKVWSTAHVMAKELVNAPELVRGKRVLEIGAGCGLNGIVAAKVGAADVVLTDVEGPVLRILAECMAINAPSERPPEHPECVEEGRSGAGEDAREGEQGVPPPSPAWDVDSMHVRLLDWSDSLRALGELPREEGDVAPLRTSPPSSYQQRDSGSLPPAEPAGTTYQVVLGNECMYEPAHAELVAAVLAQRIAPGGCALLCSAVRCLRTFRTFRSQCRQRNLRYRSVDIDPHQGGQPLGLTGRLSRDYEGGFLMIAVDHVASPFAHWHRDDFE